MGYWPVYGHFLSTCDIAYSGLGVRNGSTSAMDTPDELDFRELEDYLCRVPSVQQPIGRGHLESGGWWVKFALDISHRLAWNVVQEMGHVLNYLSLDERLPTVFMPVSPPPYLNGGPANFLSWVIESHEASFAPRQVAEWLEGRLPRPVDDDEQWRPGDENEES